MPHGRIFQFDPKLVGAHETCWNISAQGGGDVTFGSSPGWNLARAERSRLYIYSFVKGQRKDREIYDPINPITNMHNDFTLVSSISSVKRVNDYARSPVRMELDLAPRESRGYWKYHTFGKWFKQAKAVGTINNEKATMLFDSGAEVSILDTTFARKVGCVIDDSQTQECIGIGENTYMTVGRTKIKITLDGSLVYYFDVWVGGQVG